VSQRTSSSNDPLLDDLRYLADETVLLIKLDRCKTLLNLLPERSIAKSELTYGQAGVLLDMLKAVVDQAHAAVKADRNDVQAAMVLAAGAVMGLVTESPDGYRRKPSEMTRKASPRNKAARQALAAQWMIPLVGGDRQFRNHEKECLAVFSRALLDWIGMEYPPIGDATDHAIVKEAQLESSSSTAQHSTKADARGVLELRLSYGKAFVMIMVSLVLFIASNATSWWIGRSASSGSSVPTPTTSGTSGGTLLYTPRTTPTSPPTSGETYAEQGDNKNGSATFTDPHHPYVTGVKIDYTQKVEVSCKVFAVPPGWDSVTPDGYWYRIASAPWNNKYYAIANTFLNGDSLNGPTMHNTDFSVPDC